MREALLGDGPGLIVEDIFGKNWAGFVYLVQFFTDVEPFVVHHRADEPYLDIKDGALRDGLLDRRGRKDHEVLAPVTSVSARREFAIHS